MFDAVQDLRLDWLLDGIILSIVFGFAAGNYACSLVFRLPRGRLILDQKPYCGTCNTPLQVRDLFPVFSAVMLKHKCRYCGTPFPVSHTWTEILVGVLFLLAFFKYNFSEQYVMVVLIGIFLVTQAAIESNEGKVMKSVMMCVLISGILFRTLQDHSIFMFFQGGLVALVASCVLWRKEIKQVGHIYMPPDKVFLITVGGACVGLPALPMYCLLLAASYVVDRAVRTVLGAKRPPLMSVTVGVATILLVMYPELAYVRFH